MAIKTINRVFSKDNGSTNEVVCPVCEKSVCMRLFENIDASAVTYFLKKDTNTDFAVCPNCASVFSVNENYIRQRQLGTTCYLTADDLTVIKKMLKDE
ncbi:MAG: hypothetical protein ACI4W6_00890 [Acutalibacteraceae bacterium]